MLRFTLVFVCVFLAFSGSAQTKEQQKKISFGLEQDVLPYVTGGYYGAFWIGHGHMRLRTLTARVHKPDLLVPNEFQDNWVTAYAVLGEYFFKPGWQGWSASVGMVRWHSTIRKKADNNTSSFANTFVNASLSYTFNIRRQIYVTPWAGLHVRTSGPQEITITNTSFHQPLLNPEASLKVGIWF
jgi:hypothetical protein